MSIVSSLPHLRAICEFPHDSGPRQVYADWLEEQGETTRAQLIRSCSELPRPSMDDMIRKYMSELLPDRRVLTTDLSCGWAWGCGRFGLFNDTRATGGLEPRYRLFSPGGPGLRDHPVHWIQMARVDVANGLVWSVEPYSTERFWGEPCWACRGDTEMAHGMPFDCQYCGGARYLGGWGPLLFREAPITVVGFSRSGWWRRSEREVTIGRHEVGPLWPEILVGSDDIIYGEPNEYAVYGSWSLLSKRLSDCAVDWCRRAAGLPKLNRGPELVEEVPDAKQSGRPTPVALPGRRPR